MPAASAPALPETYLPFPVHRWTVEQYRALGEAGVLTEDDPVELLEGLIVPKMNLNPRHSMTVQAAHEVLRGRLPPGWCIRVQDVVTTADSEPEPDLAVVRGSHRDYADAHPTAGQTAVVIEVADSSLPRDLAKRRIYARSGIPVYWIVNLVECRIEVYTDPTGPDSEPAYRRRDDYSAADSVPWWIEQQEVARIKVADLLP
jgi:Uma2 family endonuclease